MTPQSSKRPVSAGFFTPIVGAGGGKSGGGSSRTPREDPDSLHGKAYARIIDLLGEGEIYGPAHGGDGLRDVLLNGTRVKDADGNINIPGVTVDFRAGTPFQEPLSGFPASENTVAVGVELKAATPWIREFTNTALSALRLNLGTTQYQVKTNGDRVGYRIEYAIDLSTDGGAFETVYSGAFDGKTTSKYPRSHRIELPRANANWRLLVRRVTPDSTTDLITATTTIDAVVEVVDAKLRYPMSALAGLVIDAEQFNAVPTRAYHLRLRIVRVPSNYNPETRQYLGMWDGTFKLAWTNNPAWCFFDLVSNDRYGLGTEIPAGMVDKWSLYQIGQYCDEFVPDGFGGMEPRFTCNVYMQQAADAYRVVQDMASCFRGMAYALGGMVVPNADMPSDPSDWYPFSNSNAIGGRFNYGGTSLRSRFTVAMVSWTDLSDMGRQKVEVVEDRDAISRFGLRETQVTAFACSSRAQAHRIGKWLLLTSQVETRTVSFETGLERARVMPGKIIRVSDQHLMGKRMGGRIRSATANEITLDFRSGIRAGDKLVVVLPSGLTEERTITGGRGQYLTADMTIVTVDLSEITLDMTTRPGGWLVVIVAPAFSEVPQQEAQWLVESTELSYQTFRVLSVVNKGAMTAQITALQHTPSKFDAIDYGTKLETKPATAIPPSMQPPPGNVRISSFSVIDQGVATHSATIAYDPAPSAVAYEVQFKKDQSDWISVGRTGGLSLDVRGIYTGAYQARVRAINGVDVSSLWAVSPEAQLEGNVGTPPTASHLTTTSLVMGIQLNWGFPNGPSIVGRTEIWYGATPDRSSAIKLGDFSFPQNTHTMMGLAAGVQFYFWARLVDKNGVTGAWYPEGAGVLGESSANANIILDYLLGKITSTQLSQALLERIQTGEASAVEVESILTSLAAMYTIKTQLTVDGRTVLAGLGIGVENNEGVLESQVLVFADRFAVLHPNGSGLILPFVIQDGQVIINDAVIGTATITEAKIADASITSAKIAAAAIESAHIKDASIVTAKIGVAEIDRLRLSGGAVTYQVQYQMPVRSTKLSVALEEQFSFLINLSEWTPVITFGIYCELEGTTGDGAQVALGIAGRSPIYVTPVISNDLNTWSSSYLGAIHQQIQMTVDLPAGQHTIRIFTGRQESSTRNLKISCTALIAYR